MEAVPEPTSERVPIARIELRADFADVRRVGQDNNQLNLMLDQALALFAADLASRIFAGRAEIVGALADEPALELLRPELSGMPVVITYPAIELLLLQHGYRLPILVDQPLRFASLRAGDQEIHLALTDIELADGSRILKGVIQLFVPGAGLAIALFFGTPVYSDFHQDNQVRSEIVRVTKDHRCRVDSVVEFKLGELRRLAIEDLEYEDLELGSEERRRRVCKVQLLLRLNGSEIVRIDGLEGVETSNAIRDFKNERGIPKAAYGRDQFYTALLDGIQRG